MIGIRKNNEYFDLSPGTQLQRERNSPFFIVQDSSGNDGIPGEISYPIELPLSDKNLRLTGYPDQLPAIKVAQYDVVLETDNVALSAAKLNIKSIDGHLSYNNNGTIDAELYSNASEFYKRIKDKKLGDLTFGGPRIFPWAGYDSSAPGFWKHANDTWNYNNCDNGDYVFAPVMNDGWLAGNIHINWPFFTGGRYQLSQYNACYSLVPHPYIVPTIKAIFEEHGYTVTGSILNDPDLKQAYLVSCMACYWADGVIDDSDDESIIVHATPLHQITINVAEHLPRMTIAEFLVELQKGLPIGFEIDDLKRTCEVTLMTDKINKPSKSKNSFVNPKFKLTFKGTDLKPIAFKRNTGNDSYSLSNLDKKTYNYKGEKNEYTHLPIADSTMANDAWLITYENKFYICRQDPDTGDFKWLRDEVISNILDYNTDDETAEVIETAVTPLEMWWGFVGTDDEPPAVKLFWAPICNQEGNWKGKQGDIVEWGPRIMFYRGIVDPILKQPASSNNHMKAYFPWDNTNSEYGLKFETAGNWSLSYKISSIGMIDVLFKNWIKVLQQNEIISGILNLNIVDYLQLRWQDVLLINNTPFLLKKITELLPYKGAFQFDAVRIYLDSATPILHPVTYKLTMTFARAEIYGVPVPVRVTMSDGSYHDFDSTTPSKTIDILMSVSISKLTVQYWTAPDWASKGISVKDDTRHDKYQLYAGPPNILDPATYTNNFDITVDYNENSFDGILLTFGDLTEI
ncbi:hypothetical protein QEG73_21865 [Chitinophagaceae bacterium 26-R-25]|nr:hypothetical protein [Chitinophagaceae bacterium 26-R-25]